jgi:hypothetical protein
MVDSKMFQPFYSAAVSFIDILRTKKTWKFGKSATSSVLTKEWANSKEIV